MNEAWCCSTVTGIVAPLRCTASFWGGGLAWLSSSFFARRKYRGCGANAAFNKPKIILLQRLRLGLPLLYTIHANPMPFEFPSAALYPSIHARSQIIHHISYRYMTPAALLFSLYSSKLPVPPSALAPSSSFRSLLVFASHSSSSSAMICSNLCC